LLHAVKFIVVVHAVKVAWFVRQEVLYLKALFNFTFCPRQKLPAVASFGQEHFGAVDEVVEGKIRLLGLVDDGFGVRNGLMWRRCCVSFEEEKCILFVGKSLTQISYPASDHLYH